MSAPQVPAGRPGLPRAVVVLLGLAAAFVVCAGLRAASGVLAPVFLALILTVAVSPLPRWARRHGTPAWAATLLTLVAVYSVVVVLVGGVAISAVKLASILPQYADRADELVTELGDKLGALGFNQGPTQTALSNIDLGRLLGLIESVLSGVLGAVGDLFFLVVLLFFLAAEATLASGRAAELARLRPHLTEALGRFVKGTQSYFIVCTVFGGIVAILDSIALWILGVPLPLTWGLLAFLTNFIPNIGFVLGVIPPALLALLDGGFGDMLAVLIVYCVINVVLQTFIQPRFIGDAVGLSTTMTFLSLTLWAYLLGPLGALLAVPMTLLVRALLVDPDPDATFAAALLGPPPKPEPRKRPGRLTNSG